MRLLLVRHAQTIENAEGRFQGHIHGRLSPLGKKQTRALANALKGESIDYFFGSPLGRAKETLEAVRRYHPDIRPVFTEALMERGKGIWEEMLIREAVEKDSSLLSNMRKMDYRPKGGESLNDVQKRLKPFLKRLEKLGEDETALVVGHGILNCELMRLLLKTEAHYAQENTCINEIIWRKDRVHVVRINDVAHLGELKAKRYEGY